MYSYNRMAGAGFKPATLPGLSGPGCSPQLFAFNAGSCSSIGAPLRDPAIVFTILRHSSFQSQWHLYSALLGPVETKIGSSALL